MNTEIFGRTNQNGYVDILGYEEGTAITRLDETMPTVYPVGSSLSAHHEHPAGIQLSLEDAKSLGIEIELRQPIGDDPQASAIDSYDYDSDFKGFIIKLTSGSTAYAQYDQVNDGMNADDGCWTLEREDEHDSGEITDEEEAEITVFIETNPDVIDKTRELNNELDDELEEITSGLTLISSIGGMSFNNVSLDLYSLNDQQYRVVRYVKNHFGTLLSVRYADINIEDYKSEQHFNDVEETYFWYA